MEAAHGGHAEVGDKRIALVIAVLALFLAVVETGAKSAQTQAITLNVQATNLWTFFQARTIRQTTAATAADAAELQKPAADDAGRRGIEAQQKAWRDQVAAWESNGKDGRKELSVQARDVEDRREHYMAQYHLYEYAAALLQVAIVIASASIITSTPVLLVLTLALAVGAAGLGGLGLFAPEMFHI